MPIERPPLLCLGGAEAFPDYQAAFDARYHNEQITDIRGCVVEFPADSCQHVCFKDGAWMQDRAERVLWAHVVLTHPETKIRVNWDRHDRLGYSLVVAAEDGPREYFGVVVEPRGKKKAFFVTAFPFDHDYWLKWERGGRLIYPPTEASSKKKKRR